MIRIFVVALLLVPAFARAHCPLCTAGAGVLAVFAASMGVSPTVVGVLIGATALALGIWVAGLVKTTYIPFQRPILTVVIFLSTVVPIMPLIQSYGPLYLSLLGEYGTLLHNTYTINLYVFGVVIGALLMLVAPSMSRVVTRMRGVQAPFQGVVLTMIALIGVSLVIQFWSLIRP
ncbi:MAG: hypothetical protein Q8P93_04020 [bacterium]|nr:hypothetical protein [bacterium]